MIEAYSFHTSSRFGSRVKIKIEDKNFSITGSRMGTTTYRVWLTLQGILTASIALALISSLVFLNPWYMLLAIGLLALHLWGCMWGTAIWELMNIIGHETVLIGVDKVKNFKKGQDWARKKLWMYIPLYILTINRLSPRPIFSFEAPDVASGRDVVYALMFWEEEDAICLETLLGGNHLY